MVQRANITADDGETTPVTHTYTPYGALLGGEQARWRNYNSTNPAASEIVTLRTSESKSPLNDIMAYGRRVDPRVTELRLQQFVTFVDTSTGLVMIDYPMTILVKAMVHPRASEQQAKNQRKLAVNLLNNANANQIIYAFEKGEPVT